MEMRERKYNHTDDWHTNKSLECISQYTPMRYFQNANIIQFKKKRLLRAARDYVNMSSLLSDQNKHAFERVINTFLLLF